MAQPEVSAGPVAVIGYCLGAVLAMRTATAHPDQVAAVAGFHPGFLVSNAPDSPHRLIPELTAQVHIGCSATSVGRQDRAPPRPRGAEPRGGGLG